MYTFLENLFQKIWLSITLIYNSLNNWSIAAEGNPPVARGISCLIELQVPSFLLTKFDFKIISGKARGKYLRADRLKILLPQFFDYFQSPTKKTT